MSEYEQVAISEEDLKRLMQMPAIYVDRAFLQSSSSNLRLTFGEGQGQDTPMLRFAIAMTPDTARALRNLLINAVGLPLEHKPEPAKVN